MAVAIMEMISQSGLTSPFGSMALWNRWNPRSAVEYVPSMLAPRGRRKAIIVVSDGEDNQSEVTRAQAIEMAQRAEVLIYAISTDDSGLILRGDKVLEDLASATGGRAFFPYKMKDITRSFAAIEDELRSQYDVSYKPSEFNADGRFHSIEITDAEKRPASARPARVLRAAGSRQPCQINEKTYLETVLSAPSPERVVRRLISLLRASAGSSGCAPAKQEHSFALFAVRTPVHWGDPGNNPGCSFRRRPNL